MIFDDRIGERRDFIEVDDENFNDSNFFANDVHNLDLCVKY